MFGDAPLFNQDLSSWDVSNGVGFVSIKFTVVSCNDIVDNILTIMIVFSSPFNDSYQSYMFDDAVSFNQNISSWDVSSGEDFVSTSN